MSDVPLAGPSVQTILVSLKSRREVGIGWMVILDRRCAAAVDDV
jgi:hypothetical protein